MKKLFFLLCILTAFVACSDNNDNGEPTPPIENLKMPSAETPFTTGQLVTIEGKGFTTNSQIWLRNTTKATGDIQTKITEVTDNSIVFEVPEGVEGKQNVILKQDGKEYVLGDLIFKVYSEILYALIKDNTNYGIAQIDISEKTYSMLLNITTDNLIIYTPVVSNQNIFYIAYNDLTSIGDLKCYNLNSKQETMIISQWSKKDRCAIGIIDDQLYNIKYNRNDGFSLLKVNDDGTENEIATFSTEISELKDFADNDHKFEYDPINKIILLSGFSFDNSSAQPEEIGTLIALNLNSKKAKIEYNSKKTYQCINAGDKIYLFMSDGISTDINIFNSLTLEKEKISTLNYPFDYPFYWQNKNSFIGMTSEKNLSIFELSTQKLKTIWENIEIICF